MAGNIDKVQLQVEVVRNQLDTLIKDVNNLKSQKLSITVDSTGMDAINKFNASMRTLTQNADGLGGKFTQVWNGIAEGAPVRTIETVNQGIGRTTEIIRTLNEETQSYSEVQTKTTTNYDAIAKAAQKAAEANQKAFSAAQKGMPTLQKQFADLERQIGSAVSKYPSGTFDKLSGEVKGARATLATLDSDLAEGKIGYEAYTSGVDSAKASLKELQSEFPRRRPTQKSSKTPRTCLETALAIS